MALILSLKDGENTLIEKLTDAYVKGDLASKAASTPFGKVKIRIESLYFNENIKFDGTEGDIVGSSLKDLDDDLSPDNLLVRRVMWTKKNLRKPAGEDDFALASSAASRASSSSDAAVNNDEDDAGGTTIRPWVAFTTTAADGTRRDDAIVVYDSHALTPALGQSAKVLWKVLLFTVNSTTYIYFKC